MNLTNIPDDIIIHILFNLVDIPDLFIIRTCNKRFYNLVNKWYNRYSKQYLDDHSHISIINKVPYSNKSFPEVLHELKQFRIDIEDLYSEEFRDKWHDRFGSNVIKFKNKHIITDTSFTKCLTNKYNIYCNFKIIGDANIFIDIGGIPITCPLELFSFFPIFAFWHECQITVQPHNINSNIILEYDTVYLENNTMVCLVNNGVQQYLYDIYSNCVYYGGTVGINNNFTKHCSEDSLRGLSNIHAYYVKPIIQVLKNKKNKSN